MTAVAERFVQLLLVAAGLAGAMPAAAETDADARVWLERLSAASRELNYRGTFVYQHNGRLEAMRIIHRAGPDGEQERLLALTGPAREVIRDAEKVTCILPDSRAVMVDRSLPRKPFPQSLPQDLGALERYYDFVVDGQDRVSGQLARVIEIRPRDQYRYGRRLWLDMGSHILLRSVLTAPDGEVLEQVMFTDIELPDEIPAGELAPSLTGDGFTWYGTSRRKDEQRVVAHPGSRWQAEWLPPGFMLSHESRHQIASRRDLVDHLVYTDGLATVSVYVEQPEEDGEFLRGRSRKGAMNALGLVLDGFQVTVIGEVPQATVEGIGHSMRHMR